MKKFEKTLLALSFGAAFWTGLAGTVATARADDAHVRTCIAVVPTYTAALDQFIQTKAWVQAHHVTTYGGSGKEEVEKQIQDLDKGIADFQAQLAACTK